MTSASFQIVKLNRTNVSLPVSCARCMTENPTKNYETKARALLWTEQVFGGRKETWATYTLKPHLCASCYEKLFGLRRKLTLALFAAGAVSAIMFVGLGAAALGFLKMDFDISYLGYFMIPVLFTLTFFALTFTLSPVLPLTIEAMGEAAQLVLDNEAFAASFIASNQSSCGDVLTRVVKPRTWAFLATPAAVLLFLGLEAMQVLPWIQTGIQHGGDPRALPLLLGMFGWLILSGLAMILASIIFMKKNQPYRARRFLLAGTSFSIGFLLLLELQFLNPLTIILALVAIAMAALSLEIRETKTQLLPPPP